MTIEDDFNSDDDSEDYAMRDIITGRKLQQRKNPLRIGKPTKYDFDNYFLDEKFI